MYPYIQIFGHSISSYGLIAVLAAILCGVLFITALKKTGAMIEDGILFFVFVIFGVIVGGHLLYAITQYRYIPSLFQRAELSLWIARVQYVFGGSVFYGGLLGGLGSGYLGLKILKQDIHTYSDFMAPIIPLFHGIARIGCFLAGCCYGVPCEWGFAAEGNIIVPEVNGITRFPIQLLESACNFVLAGILLLLLQRSRQHPMLSGNLLKIYLIVYGIIRFADEFLRGDAHRGFWGVLSTSQWISLVTVSVGAILLARSIIGNKTEEND